MSQGFTCHVRVGTEFGDLHIIELPDTHQTIEKIKNEICKIISTVTQTPSNFALMMSGVRLLPEFRKFDSVESVKEFIDRGAPIEIVLAPVERDVLAARYNFYKYRSHGSNQPMIIRVPKFPLASNTTQTQSSTTNSTDNATTNNTSSHNSKNEPDVTSPLKTSVSTGDARSPATPKATILTSKSSDNARGSYKLPRSSSNRWRKIDDDCTYVPMNELDEAPMGIVAAVASTPRPDVQKIFAENTTTTTTPTTKSDSSEGFMTTQENSNSEKKEEPETGKKPETSHMVPLNLDKEKGLVARVKEMSIDDPLSSRGSSEFYQMMKEGAAVMVAKESTKKINSKKHKSRRKSKDARDQDLSMLDNGKDKLRKRVKRKKSRSTQSATDLWPTTPETPRKESPLTSSGTKHASLMIDDTAESQKRERWAKITSQLNSYEELIKLGEIQEEDESKTTTTTTTTNTDGVVEANTNGDLNKGISKEENRRKKERADRRKKKQEHQELKKKMREEEEKKKAEEEAKRKAEEEAKEKQSKRMSRVLGDVKDLYELISESEDELKRRKEEERLQREEEEQDEAQSLYEFLGSGSDSDSANEILIFSEDGEAVLGVNAEENSAGDVSFRKKRKQESGSGSDGDDGDGLIFEEDAEVENHNDKSKRKGSAPVLGNGKVEANGGSGSDGEDDDDGGLVFYTEEGENVKVETKKNKKQRKGKERSQTVPSIPVTAPTTPMPVARTSSKILSRGQSKKEIDNYLKEQKEKKKKEKEREKQEKANKKKQLKSSGKVKSKLWF